ncbi:MAG: carboxyl transferase domain-containing protein, partial [Eggerthellaceae bacterium]|nr:carboxyl transferase domain-containing protein [Eggerthellaceae bacterium]
MFTRKKYILIEPNDRTDGAAPAATMRPFDGQSQQSAVKAADLPPTGSVIDPTLVAYQLETLLSYAGQAEDETAVPALLLAGYGSALKEAVRAFKQAGAPSVFVTGTADKERGFSFSGFAQVVSLGAAFDKRLFANEYALAEAAEACGARYLLLCDGSCASDLLCRVAAEKGMRVLSPMEGDKTFTTWVVNECALDASEAACEPVTWKKCPKCKLNHEASEVLATGGVCPTCGELYRLTSEERIDYLFDADTFEEWETGLPETDPLGFPDYDSLLSGMRKKSDREEAVRCGKAKIANIEVALCIMETTFMMGSMGSVVGEKITRTIERATALGLPLLIFTASGGARMQEGLVSL